MKLLYDFCLTLVGMKIPYRWGGKNPMIGLDCSGLIQYILQSFGVGPKETFNSQSMYDYWSKYGTKSAPALGGIVFFGKSESRIVHVALCIDEKRMIEAANGDSNCDNLEEAIKRMALVKISPISRRKDLIGIYMPNYGS